MTHIAIRRFCSATIATCSLIMAVTVCADYPASATRSSQSRYHVVHGWPILPDGFILGHISGVGVDSHDNVFVFHRAERTWVEPFPTEPIQKPTIMLFAGRTGKVLASWGERIFIMPHGLTVDHQDNVWVTDVGLHQVFKFSHNGKLLLTLGERGMPGADGSHFNRPTDVAVLPDGSFYVSDGYRNSRVAKFSAEGRFLFEWGKKGSGHGEFDLPHGIALDAQGRVYVADRSNSRIQVFDDTGKFLDEWSRSLVGRPFGVSVGADGYVYVVDGGDQPDTFPDRARVIKLNFAGKIVDSFGRFGNYDGQFNRPHDLAVAKGGAVYVVDLRGTRVQKFINR
jgi:peptidylamidoglycolate lyase